MRFQRICVFVIVKEHIHGNGISDLCVLLEGVGDVVKICALLHFMCVRFFKLR